MVGLVLGHAPAAVDADDLAGDVAALVAAQEEGKVGVIVGRQWAAAGEAHACLHHVHRVRI